MLSDNEKDYFNSIVKFIKQKINVNIPIIPYDHDLLQGKSKEALGCSWSKDKIIVDKITIDEYFIQECYGDYMYRLGYKSFVPKVEEKSIEEVICHEIAHMSYWRHGKKHRELTRELIMLVNSNSQSQEYIL
ncbi:hypothetical protein KHQ81_15910 (plasmid) [Mycoplasmatota bacterium]|nr:hypothetical protein KHQ81_15910 [Mycoplasmatota bacterium]